MTTFAPPGVVVVSEFRGDHEFLSNFYRFQFYYAGRSWATAEHAFQAEKTDNPDWKVRIQLAGTPMAAKKLGRRAPMRPGWDLYGRHFAMRAIIATKFAPGLWTADRLVATGNAVLIEGNNHHDNTWGACLCISCADVPKHNLLGYFLMQHRFWLRTGGVW